MHLKAHWSQIVKNLGEVDILSKKLIFSRSSEKLKNQENNEKCVFYNFVVYLSAHALVQFWNVKVSKNMFLRSIFGGTYLFYMEEHVRISIQQKC